MAARASGASHHVEGADDGGDDTWSGAPSLSRGDSVSYFVQALDGAGNVASGDNKGFYFEPVTYKVYLPLVLRNH